jgi:hypothetical protein
VKAHAKRHSQRLNQITSALQEGIEDPDAAHRSGLESCRGWVGDVANSCGKRIELEMDGSETS